MCNNLRASIMKSFGRHEGQPQAPTSTLVLVLMIYLLIPYSASAAHFDNTSFNFPSFGSESLKLLDIQGNASVLSPYLHLSLSQPNRSLNDMSGRATYSKKVHLWDKATGNEADYTARFMFSINSQHRNDCGDGLTFFVAPWGSSMSDGGSHLALPNYSYVAVEVDTFKNLWDADVPHVGIDLNDLRSVANVTVPGLTYKIMNGGSVNASITYDSQARNLSVVLMDADGNSSNSASLHYAPLSISEYLPEWVDVGFSAATGAAYEYHIVHSWEFSSSLRLRAEKTTFSWWKALLIAVGGGVGVLVIIFVARVAWVRYLAKVTSPYMSNDIPGENNAPETIEENITETERGGEEGDHSVKLTEEFEKLSGPKKLSNEEVMMAIKSCEDRRILGRGGFGKVYKGYIGDTSKPVAVKILSSDSEQGVKEYKSEVRAIIQLRHRNLVPLIGYCHEANNFILVYEFMSEGSLNDRLFKDRRLLTWESRYKICLGLASALHYLHEQCNQCVIHRDIKSSNIMLDEDLEAKLGDFGLARLIAHARGQKTTEAIGTEGYAAPEYYETGKASKKSDVFSFGVVLQEIVTGRSAEDLARAERDPNALVKWAWEQYGRKKLLDAMDARIGKNFDKKQAKALMTAGLWCAHPIASSRPSIEEAMSVLNLKAEPPKLPSKMPPVPVVGYVMCSYEQKQSRSTNLK